MQKIGKLRRNTAFYTKILRKAATNILFAAPVWAVEISCLYLGEQERRPKLTEPRLVARAEPTHTQKVITSAFLSVRLRSSELRYQPPNTQQMLSARSLQLRREPVMKSGVRPSGSPGAHRKLGRPHHGRLVQRRRQSRMVRGS